MTVKTGTTFAGYHVESLVGRGGMGVVYRAVDESLKRPVALKLIAPELSADERFRDRFLREPRLAASLDHPNVIPIYEAGERDGQLYLAMRFVEGYDLRRALSREGKLSAERALAILAQVAGALDAAHRRGLVHRDVKPANVLVDEDGHTYLTDFGITKQIDSASTDTGRVVGTLDYLAPEQIRGDPVDGRTDCYALACVLYECLAGVPPFRRRTEAETLWAHMTEESPPLRSHPRLDPVLRKALAKERKNRYTSASGLIAAAGAALGLGAREAVRRPLVGSGLPWAARPVLAGAILLLAGAVAAATVSLTNGDDAGAAPLATGVAAIDFGDGGVEELIETRVLPGALAAGEGSLWVVGDGDDVISRIDPETKEVTGTVDTPGAPTQLATGFGALWVGKGGGRFVNTTVGISRVEPSSGRVTRTVNLPDSTGGGFTISPNTGFTQIAVGAGAVWARNPDDDISRIDPRKGELMATIPAGASTVAAGREGVWFVPVDRPAVKRIDPRTNRVTQTVPIGANSLPAIAVGAGSVWATAENEGVVWRIEPGERPVTRTIHVGVGVSHVAFGGGAVWTTNYMDGTVSRIDPRTNAVTARVFVGAPQALAVGEGSVWAGIAGSEREALPTFACREVVAGGREPDVVVASDLPLKGPQSAGPRAMADAIRTVFERHGFRAGRHAVGYASCDDSTEQSGTFELRRCAANANSYAHTERLLAVIGPYNSGCATVQIPILNRAPGGPLAMISPSNTHPGLTRGGPPRLPPGVRGQPGVFYPTGERHYLRVIARDDVQGAGHALLARELGLESVYVLYDDEYWKGLLQQSVGRAARRLDVRIAGSEGFDPAASAKSQIALADEVARSGAEGVVLGAFAFNGGDRMLRALRARLGRRVPIIASDGFWPIPDVVDLAGPASRGLYISITDVPANKRLERELGHAANEGYTMQAAQAAELVLQAIARSDGTRASVLERLRASRTTDGPLGSFRFDRNGDITPAKVTILRVNRDAPKDPRLPPSYRGATVDRVLDVPASLSG